MQAEGDFVDRDVVHFYCGRDIVPRLVVDPGAVVEVATHDARGGHLKRPEDVIPTAPRFDGAGHPRTNPVSGPIGVRGAAPGDAIAVTIAGIELDPMGFIIARPEWGIVKDSVPHQVAKMLPVEGDAVVFDGRFRIPLRANIGTIGLAPAGEGISTIHCGAHGGNIDSNSIAIGATVHLPVAVDLGLLFIGDIHAVMGDAEGVGTGCEIGGRVRLRVELVKDAARAWPWIETETLIITYGAAPSFEAAATIAMEEMIAMVGARHGLSYADAFMLIGLAGDVRVNQACGAPINVSVRVEFPKHLAAVGA